MIDFIAAIPTEIFSMFTSSESNATNLLQLIGIFEIKQEFTKLSRVIKYLNLKSGVKMTIETMNIYIFICSFIFTELAEFGFILLKWMNLGFHHWMLHIMNQHIIKVLHNYKIHCIIILYSFCPFQEMITCQLEIFK